MIEVFYTKKFIKLFAALDEELRERVIEKINLFQNPAHHKQLAVHKLRGNLKHLYSFSVDRKYRIVFRHGKDKREAILLVVGDHDVYHRG